MVRFVLRALTSAVVITFASLVAVVAPARAAVVDTAPLFVPVAAVATAFDALGPYPETAFTSDCHVLDDFAPYEWSGAGAPRRWYAALIGTTPADRMALAATHPHLVFGAPQFARVTGKRAYLVVPGTLSFAIHGNAKTQHGRWTLVEVRSPGGWRIASQAWAIVDGFADE